MLFGAYEYQLDVKNRVRLPAKFQSELGASFLITRGKQGCLYLLSEEKKNDLESKIKNIPLGSKLQDSLRSIFSMAYEVEPDAQGRFVLPLKLREHANLQRDVVMIGVGDRAEIWAKDKWNASCDTESFDGAIDALGEFGI